MTKYLTRNNLREERSWGFRIGRDIVLHVREGTVQEEKAAGHTESAAWKQTQAIEPQGPPPMTHFLQ